MTISAHSPVTLLSPSAWRELEDAHHAHADALTADHRARTARHEKHPVWDFLFQYYSYKPAVLRRWHPGAQAALQDARDAVQASWRWYRTGADGSVALDLDSFRIDRGEGLARVVEVLRATAGRPGRFGCFGMHEWAMVYRGDEHRHAVPLRLGQAATDDVVEAHELRCTHFDAFRFFTPPAVPRNESLLTRESQVAQEQPGCLHAGMDLYKWAIKLGPLVPGEVLLQAFELARDVRRLDMEASPYDLTDWGFSPVAVETAEGKAEYVRRQRSFADRGTAIRAQLMDAASVLWAESPAPVAHA